MKSNVLIFLWCQAALPLELCPVHLPQRHPFHPLSPFMPLVFVHAFYVSGPRPNPPRPLLSRGDLAGWLPPVNVPLAAGGIRHLRRTIERYDPYPKAIKLRRLPPPTLVRPSAARPRGQIVALEPDSDRDDVDSDALSQASEDSNPDSAPSLDSTPSPRPRSNAVRSLPLPRGIASPCADPKHNVRGPVAPHIANGKPSGSKGSSSSGPTALMPIPKPREGNRLLPLGKARPRGYNLKTELGWPEAEYKRVDVSSDRRGCITYNADHLHAGCNSEHHFEHPRSFEVDG
jgi:hypothetical protein